MAWKRESAETEWESVNNQTTNNYSFFRKLTTSLLSFVKHGMAVSQGRWLVMKRMQTIF